MKQNTVNKKFAKGFTLLELLVVVIIIGILAAIALPQYQLAVDKSKFAGYRTMAKSLADAYRRYLLTNSTTPTDIDDLDINLPQGYTKTSPMYQSCAVFDDMFCCVARPKKDYQNGGVTCGDKNNTIAIGLTLLAASDQALPNDYIKSRCYAKTNDKRAVKLCESISYTPGSITYLHAQSGPKSGYTLYSIK